MPTPKYYCDYCDKQFDDTPAARRRHLSGPLHQRAKKQWFDSFKDEEQTPGQDHLRGVCVQFSNTGFCPYGVQCKYVHHVPRPWLPVLPGQAAVFNPGPPARPENNLPPSLQPPREDCFNYLHPLDWG